MHKKESFAWLRRRRSGYPPFGWVPQGEINMSLLKSGYTVEHLAAMPGPQLSKLIQSLPREQADEVLCAIPAQIFRALFDPAMIDHIDVSTSSHVAGWASVEDQQDFGVRR